MVSRGIAEAVRERIYFKLIYRLRACDGAEKWVLEQGCGVLADSEDAPEYLEGVVMDITEIKRAEQELRRAYEQLQETQQQLIQAEKMKIVGTLASSVAHEVKNPLAIITQGLDYLAKNPPSQDTQLSQVLGYMADAVTRADTIVKGLLDFSRITKVEMKPDDLHGVIDKALSLVKSDCAQSHVAVTTDFATDIPLIAFDRNKIEQVFINIFMNAVHAMPNGGGLHVKTSLVQHATRRAVKVEVLDTGTGIPEQQLQKIFEPFFTTQHDKGGTGLGLSIVKNIIEMHGGTIVFANRRDTCGVCVALTFKI